ncbi:hypothetical protein [Parasitella parasitica]|uniref:C2H2-type domain-containing protein n=1 Tax=Parasitella parasitica TaxID=35722 RepID=A0A0B7NDY6_9FUNG|nr:hypothetical protein [Parasitella parasitica]
MGKAKETSNPSRKRTYSCDANDSCTLTFSSVKKLRQHTRSFKHAPSKKARISSRPVLFQQEVEVTQEGDSFLSDADEWMEDQYTSDMDQDNNRTDQTPITEYDIKYTVPPTLIFQDTLDTIVKSKCPIAYKDLTICKRGCMVLKNKTDQCPNKDCTSSSKQTKQRTVRLGQEYQMLSKSSACENSGLNIFVALFIDGFVNSNVSRDSKFTLIHALVLNLPPSHRFQDKNMIQLAILNNQGPLNIDSYVDCILNYIKAISEDGMRVLKNGQEIFKKVTVHLSMVTGDSVSTRTLAHMKMYNFKYPCMLCRVHRETHKKTGLANQLLIENQEKAQLKDLGNFFHGDEEV